MFVGEQILSSVSSEELEKILDVVEAALANHSKWYDDLVRGLLCRSVLSSAVVAKDAHRQCAFGVWFYGMGEVYVQEIPVFRRIGELHHAMHTSARDVVQIVRANGYATELEYDSFHRKLTEFRGELDGLRSRICHTLAHTDARERLQESTDLGGDESHGESGTEKS